MSLPDGEYDIDLAQLLDLAAISPQNDHDNVAMRYGFIPDSMDQSKPLTLYQRDQECILLARSNDDKPIIFEGIPQRHRGNSNITNDSYYLTYVPSQSKTIKLKRLNSTIRFSKSRNVSKLQTKMVQWEKEHEAEQKKKHRQETQMKNSTPTPTQKQNRPSISSKRAPIRSENSTPAMLERPEEAIISESDFDDLNDFDFDNDKSAQFPIIVLDDERKREATPVQSRNYAISKQQEVPTVIVDKPKKVRAKPKPIVEKVDESIDMDDDFKDLEDQLQEVLEEDESGGSARVTPEPQKGTPAEPFGISFDSDESDADDYGYSGLGITINVDEGTPSTSQSSYRFNSDQNQNQNHNQKPTSLRDLVGDDGSSSEEE